MKRTLTTLLLGALLGLGSSGLVLANKPVEKEAFEAAIKGNTVEGRKIKWETTYKMYFAPSGDFRRIDSLNNKEKGKWSVNKNGDLVMEGRKTQTRTVKQRDDGGYDIYSNRDEVIWTIDKILPGDPYELSK